MRVMIVLAIGALLLSGCRSPETKRERGGGPGADLGYRGETVELHAGSEPYYETPRLIAPAEDKNKDRQARRP